jgi:hypothetical protein
MSAPELSTRAPICRARDGRRVLRQQGAGAVEERDAEAGPERGVERLRVAAAQAGDGLGVLLGRADVAQQRRDEVLEGLLLGWVERCS